MKKIKKVSALMLAVVMALAMSITAFAQTVALDPADGDNATITINNAAKGETYSIYKLFDATVSGDKIAYQYTGNSLPTGLDKFFTKDDEGNVTPKDIILDKDSEGKVKGTKMTAELQAALEAWAGTVQPTAKTPEGGSDGSVLTFTGLPYGYYVMLTSHKSDVPEGSPEGTEAKAAITVTSTQPNASIYDKNTNEPSAVKEVEKASYSIGDTVKYTATFDTTNYMTKDGTSEQVVKYVINDTLPEYLSNIKVTSVTIGGAPYTVGEGDQAKAPQFDNKQIEIPWATGTKGNYTNIYAQGAQIVVKYEAVLTSTTNINKADVNTVSITPYVDRGGDDPEPWDEPWKDTAEITTYAAAIKKVDENKNALAGAEFTIAGLVVEKVEDGVYRVVSYDPKNTTASEAMVTDAEGKLYIVGLASDVTLTVTEAKAPDGYNKLTKTVPLTPQVLETTIYETSGERHYDKDGNLVSASSTTTTTETVAKNLAQLDAAALEIENSQGTLLPSTGGIGTTIFYIIGGILVIGAGIILVVKKRASNE